MKKRILFYLSIITIIIVFASCSNSSSDNNTEETSDDFPNKPIELIVPFDTGGGNDLVARTLAKHVNKHLPNEEEVNIVNKPGGSGVIGTTELFNEKPD